MIVGSTQNITAEFYFPDNVNPIISFQLLDKEAVYVSGLADEVTVTPVNKGYLVNASAFITIPSNIPPGRYTIRWEAKVNELSHYLFEHVQIEPSVSSEIGALPSVELYPMPVTLRAVLPTEQATVSIYSTELLYTQQVTYSFREYAGNTFLHTINTNNYSPSLDPFLVSWNYGTETVTGDLFIITPPILQATRELYQFFNRLHQKLKLEELTFTVYDLIRFLRLGKDKFNGHGLLTEFDMTMAAGSIQYWWLICSQIMALRSLYLDESLSSFSFSGQAVTLEVNSDYIDSLLSRLEGELEGLTTFKRQLAQRGITGGKGNEERLGKIPSGSVGLTKSPISSI